MDRLQVAIIGGGPAGLSAAIELSRLPWVDWKLYEQKPNISEIGTGLTLQRNTWRLLEHLGASRHIRASDFFRPSDGHDTQYRNGRTGAIINQTYPPNHVPPHQAPCRIHRAKLQQALLREVDQSRIECGKKLRAVEQIPSRKLRLQFDDRSSEEVDLLVGADGIRSVVRRFVFPKYEVQYTGMTAYRATVGTSDAEQINGLSKAIIFWYGTDGKWIYTCPLNRNEWEITCRIKEPEDGDRSTWGKEVNVERFRDKFNDFGEPIQQLLKLITRLKRFDYFAGSRLPTIINYDSVALIGDASHPLSGAFGAGAAFAIEDSYALAGSLAWAARSHRTLADALNLFNDVRSPHYQNLYQTLDRRAATIERQSPKVLSEDDAIALQVEAVSNSDHNWMYYHEVDLALADATRSDRGAVSKARL